MAILSMMDTIFYKLMQRFEAKKKETLQWHGKICPKIRENFDKLTEWSLGAALKPSGNGLYHVRTGELVRDYDVDFLKKTCDCNRWQLSGIPCHHAIACCRLDMIDVDSLVHKCYTIDSYLDAYGHSLVPLRGRVLWQKMNGVQVLPPLYTKVMGRPKKNRKKAPKEKEKNGSKYVTKGGVTIHCSICKQPDHNKKGHQKYVQSQMEQGQLGGVEAPHDEEYDDPSILQNIISQQPDLRMDPTNLIESMVYNLAQEARANEAIDITQEPIPQESSFVAAARESIPGPRVRMTTATTSGRGRAARNANASGRGGRRGSGRGAGQGSGTGAWQAERRGRKRATAQALTSGTNNAQVSTRAHSRGPGSAYYLLFGDDNQQQRPAIPDLNAQVEAEEMPVTQNAPI